jgi:hypothetical protein
MGNKEAPVCNAKIKMMAGFREEFPWRKVLGIDGAERYRVPVFVPPVESVAESEPVVEPKAEPVD